MKKVILSLTLASTVLLSSGYTYDEHGHEHLGTAEIATLEVFKNDIIDNSNQIEFATKKEGTVAVSGTLSIGNEIKYFDITPRYNITENIGLDARLPIVQNSDTDKFGIGDFSVAGNYHFGNPGSQYGTNISTLRYKSSTGSDTDGLGTGEGTISLTHTLAKNLQNSLRVHGLVTYQMNMGDIDDAIAIMGGLSHTNLIDYAIVNTKLTYYTRGNLSVADLWAELSSEKMIGLPFSAGIKIPLINSYDGTDLDKSFVFYLSATGFFN